MLCDTALLIQRLPLLPITHQSSRNSEVDGGKDMHILTFHPCSTQGNGTHSLWAIAQKEPWGQQALAMSKAMSNLACSNREVTQAGAEQGIA